MYKKIISVLAVLAIMSAVCAFPVYGAEYTKDSKFMWGDVDFDGAVTVKDATLIQKGLAKIEYVDAVQRYIADPQGIGYSVKNATAIQKYLAKYESLASWGEEISMASQDEFSSNVELASNMFYNVILVFPKNDSLNYTLEDFSEFNFTKIERQRFFTVINNKLGDIYDCAYELYFDEADVDYLIQAIKALDYRANLDLEAITVVCHDVPN